MGMESIPHYRGFRTARVVTARARVETTGCLRHFNSTHMVGAQCGNKIRLAELLVRSYRINFLLFSINITDNIMRTSDAKYQEGCSRGCPLIPTQRGLQRRQGFKQFRCLRLITERLQGVQSVLVFLVAAPLAGLGGGMVRDGTGRACRARARPRET